MVAVQDNSDCEAVLQMLPYLEGQEVESFFFCFGCSCLRQEVPEQTRIVSLVVATGTLSPPDGSVAAGRDALLECGGIHRRM